MPRGPLRLKAAGGIAALVPILIAGGTTTAGAKTYDVRSPRDAGKGTLREAVADANRHKGSDRIAFSRKLRAPIRLRRDLVVRDPLTIAGNGGKVPTVIRAAEGEDPTIAARKHDGPLAIREMHLRSVGVKAATSVKLTGSTVIGRRGGGRSGIGIDLSCCGRTLVEDSELSHWEYGIRDRSGHTKLVRSRLAENGTGLDVRQASNTRITGSIIEGNGAGIYAYESMFNDLRDSVVRGNSPRGGVSIVDLSDIDISGSTIADNEAVRGGGIFSAIDSDLRMVNSTVSGNTATGSDSYVGRGGGIYGGYHHDEEITATTITGNTAAEGGGIFLDGRHYSLFYSLKASIVAGNSAPAAPDCSLGLEDRLSDGENVFGPDGCGPAGPGDQLTADPGLGSLADNGGSTPTHALLPGSPAIGNAPGLTVAFDQRHVRRDGMPDSGSFEARAQP